MLLPEKRSPRLIPDLNSLYKLTLAVIALKMRSIVYGNLVTLQAFRIGGLNLAPFPVCGNHFNRGTNCTPFGGKLRITSMHFLDVLFRVCAFSQNRNNILNREIPFFLFFVSDGTNFAAFKKLNRTVYSSIILCIIRYPFSQGRREPTGLYT